MVRCICPTCGKKGSICHGNNDANENKYWYVYHSKGEGKKDVCYLGRGPVKVDVISDDKAPVGTKKVTFDDDTNMSDF